MLGWQRTHKDPDDGRVGAHAVLASCQSRTITSAISSGSCTAALPDAISPYTSAPYSEGCARSGPIYWKPGKSSGRKK